MYISNIWSAGQLFAFSGLDGQTDYKADFTGILSGDRVGIRFNTKIRRELAVVGYGTHDLQFDAVTGDCIIGKTQADENIRLVFLNRHLVIGDRPADGFVTVFAEGPISATEPCEGVTVWGDDSEYTALAQNGNRFAFAFGTSAEAAAKTAKNGLEIDLDAAVECKMAYYRQHSIDDEKYGKLYSKCVSVMKTQVYAPEGRFSGFWSTPDRLPHKALWLWDSVFHSIGHRHLHPEISEQLILSVLETQQENGMIPHMSSPYWSSDISQPPVLAWGALKVFEKTQNKSFLKKVFDANRRFLAWCDANRRVDADALYSWNTTEKVDCRCDESGMDNSPRFDDKLLLKTTDFSCFMANEMRMMSKIAVEIGENTAEFDRRFEEIKNCINEKLWCDEDGFYYDVDANTGRFHKVGSVASFLPLFAGVCDGEKAEKLVKYMHDPKTFGTPFGIPCLAADHPTFGTDMWRGPVWINYNYMIAEGLENYGHTAEADGLRQKTLDTVNRWYTITGTMFEYYDSADRLPPNKLNRKGAVVEPYDFRIRYQAIRDYGWTTTLTFDLLNDWYNNY